MKQREKLGSRLGFLLLSAGCAIGVGNVWRFPYITGQYGGGFFVLIYLIFLVILGIPVITMEYAVGRASGLSILPAYKKLEPKGTKWHLIGYLAMAGNYVLLMYYSVISGWMLYYFFLMVRGEFVHATSEDVQAINQSMMGSPKIQLLSMLAIMVLTTLICSAGLQNSVEKITKVMMTLLIVIMLALGVRSILLPGSSEGLSFYLKPTLPDSPKKLWNTVYAALNQSFFTLSIGMGGMEIFGSYIDRKKTLAGEAIIVTVLDTLVALVSGLIIFPACYAYHIAPDSGSSLIFLTLPRVFSNMPGGRIWGSLFFLFLTFAALSTMIGVFENDVSFAIDLRQTSRKKAALVTGLIITIGSIPCALGFNVLGNIHPLRPDKVIMDLEDFFVSNICLPFGSLIFILFCTSRFGWGLKNYMAEANTGTGPKISKPVGLYFKYLLPFLVAFLVVYGIVTYF